MEDETNVVEISGKRVSNFVLDSLHPIKKKLKNKKNRKKNKTKEKLQLSDEKQKNQGISIPLNFGDRNKEDLPTPISLLNAIKDEFGDYFDPCPLGKKKFIYSFLPLDIFLIFFRWKKII